MLQCIESSNSKPLDTDPTINTRTTAAGLEKVQDELTFFTYPFPLAFAFSNSSVFESSWGAEVGSDEAVLEIGGVACVTCGCLRTKSLH